MHCVGVKCMHCVGVKCMHCVGIKCMHCVGIKCMHCVGIKCMHCVGIKCMHCVGIKCMHCVHTCFRLVSFPSSGGNNVYMQQKLCVAHLSPLPFLFKALLHGQKDHVFFSGRLIYTLKQERFRAIRPAGGI
jgi:hypothetical protein